MKSYDQVVQTTHFHQSTGEILDQVSRGQVIAVQRYKRVVAVLVSEEEYEQLQADRAELRSLRRQLKATKKAPTNQPDK